jgi:hypothetical protein
MSVQLFWGRRGHDHASSQFHLDTVPKTRKARFIVASADLSAERNHTSNAVDSVCVRIILFIRIIGPCGRRDIHIK